eukprot:gene23718-9269_t
MSISVYDIKTASFTSNVKEVDELTLTNKGLVDLGDVGEASNLRALSLAFNSLTSISALVSLKNLQTLNVSHNSVVSLKAIGSLVGLKTLNASHNKIVSGLAGLSKCSQLQYLYIQKNQIKNPEELRALSSLTPLKRLCCTSNPICSSLEADTSRLVLIALSPNLEILYGGIVTGDDETSAAKINLADALRATPAMLDGGEVTSDDKTSAAKIDLADTLRAEKKNQQQQNVFLVLQMLDGGEVTGDDKTSAAKINLADALRATPAVGSLCLAPPSNPSDLNSSLRSAGGGSSSAPLAANRRRGSSPMLSRTPSRNLRSQAGDGSEWLQGEHNDDAKSVRSAVSECTSASRTAKAGRRRGGKAPSAYVISEGSSFMAGLMRGGKAPSAYVISEGLKLYGLQPTARSGSEPSEVGGHGIKLEPSKCLCHIWGLKLYGLPSTAQSGSEPSEVGGHGIKLEPSKCLCNIRGLKLYGEPFLTSFLRLSRQPGAPSGLLCLEELRQPPTGPGKGVASEDGGVSEWLRNAVDDDVMSVRSSLSEDVLGTSVPTPRSAIAGRRSKGVASEDGGVSDWQLMSATLCNIIDDDVMSKGVASEDGGVSEWLRNAVDDDVMSVRSSLSEDVLGTSVPTPRSAIAGRRSASANLGTTPPTPSSMSRGGPASWYSALDNLPKFVTKKLPTTYSVAIVAASVPTKKLFIPSEASQQPVDQIKCVITTPGLFELHWHV